MRLKHIKLSGFKSFVDPTTISVPAQLVGVVGPNGCGKSNVIDAVRWVMGESSAKNLRGDHMADVIFNGSTARKPVGKAAVELVFDNSEGRAPGAYGQYGEIAVRRELSRDGESSYFVNRTKCRRRDITDIFLGTGLGARSYSIIEQGMVSRIIEARPEDLRVLVEEASGVSKYKERRRETETRMRHTRENLSRLEDIRNELEAQLKRLKRQSGDAERYKTLKQQERLLRAQLLAIRWRNLDHDLASKDGELAHCQTEVEAKVAEQRGTETRIEALRRDQTEANDRLNSVQADYYRIGAQISRVEQNMDHLRETREQRRQELERLAETRDDTQRHLDADRNRIAELEQALAAVGPRLGTAAETLAQATRRQQETDQALQAWQSQWDELSGEAARPEQEREVQRTRIEEHEQQILRLVERQNRLESGLKKLGTDEIEAEVASLTRELRETEAKLESLGGQLETLDGGISETRDGLARAQRELMERRDRHHEIHARSLSLKELQAAALGEDDQSLQDWLHRQDLDGAPRLSSSIRIESGWEQALDRVLGQRAGAVCVAGLDRKVADMEFIDADLFLVETGARQPSPPRDLPTLLDRIEACDVDLSPWLDGVFTAESLTQARQLRSRLADSESIVTRDGRWLGRNWIALATGDGQRGGVLLRESEIEDLERRLEASQAELDQIGRGLEQFQSDLERLQHERGELRQTSDQTVERRSTLRQDLARREAQLAELESRRKQITQDLQELNAHLQQGRDAVLRARELMSEADRAATDYARRREQLLSQRDRLRADAAAANKTLSDVRDAHHRLQFEQQGLRTELQALGEAVSRLDAQRKTMSQRQLELETFLNDDEQPEQDLKTRLDELLEERLRVEQALQSARQRMEELDTALRQEEQTRAGFEQQTGTLREALEGARVARQELLVRRDSVADQIAESEHEPADLLREIPADAAAEEWQQELDSVVRKVDRIGPVNLVAIDEYEEQSKRKENLDKQYADLTEALGILESAIQKIDRETRARFKETFEQLNERFQGFFPRLFGGGSAYLELTSADLLETGVTVMARPPGKRNSTIHLLSGGEKAMTAVALMFSFFDLNPAPFCMLDEVDAPLDDANVERYCEILASLSDRTQLIFITHNKITMERADILIGVTMGEPGVSRLVAVDVSEAMEMATQ